MVLSTHIIQTCSIYFCAPSIYSTLAHTCNERKKTVLILVRKEHPQIDVSQFLAATSTSFLSDLEQLCVCNVYGIEDYSWLLRKF